MRATGLSTADIVININKNKSHSSSQNKTTHLWRILYMDITQKEKASFAL